MRELFDQGMTLEAAARIVELQDSSPAPGSPNSRPNSTTMPDPADKHAF